MVGLNEGGGVFWTLGDAVVEGYPLGTRTIVGACVGCCVGVSVGSVDGCSLGAELGRPVGAADGRMLGDGDGYAEGVVVVGCNVGELEGRDVGARLGDGRHGCDSPTATAINTRSGEY